MKKPLLPRDGAKFLARIQSEGDGFRASCHAQLVMEYGARTELPSSRLFDTREDAMAWIESRGSTRGFPGVHMEDLVEKADADLATGE
jgi:hypothetical protein